MEEKYYSFKLESTTLLLSIVLPLSIFVPIMLMTIVFMVQDSLSAALIPAAIGLILLLIHLAIAAFSPKGAIVTPEGITVVKRYTKPVVVPASQIVSIETADRSLFRHCIRTCGCGGFLGSWGYFSSSALDSFRAYVTNTDSLVLIRTIDKGPFVISPENPEDFVATAKSFGLMPESR